jgi:hypothetical protein
VAVKCLIELVRTLRDWATDFMKALEDWIRVSTKMLCDGSRLATICRAVRLMISTLWEGALVEVHALTAWASTLNDWDKSLVALKRLAAWIASPRVCCAVFRKLPVDWVNVLSVSVWEGSLNAMYFRITSVVSMMGWEMALFTDCKADLK